MNIEEFFELSAGKWFSHRNSHDLAFKQSESGKSRILIEMLAADHPEVIKLCQQYKVDSSGAACGAKIAWNNTNESDKEKYNASTVLVTIPDANNPNEGKLLRELDSAEKTPVTGSYKIGSDDALTLTLEDETIWSQERLWFASPNLRMRVSVMKRCGGFTMASFTSEIRLGGTPAPAKVSNTANSASS